MVRRFVMCGLLLTLSQASFGDDKPGVKLPAAPTNAGLEKMKKLAGTWLAADKDGKPTDQVASIIKVTAGGSAVHETLFPGQPQEMVSVYTVDGPDLIMTHYCVLGNQPRMKADPNSSANQIVFQFAGGGNLDPKKDQTHARSDPHLRRRRPHRGQRHRLGQWCARQGHVLWDKARSEEIGRTSEFVVSCSLSRSASGATRIRAALQTSGNLTGWVRGGWFQCRSGSYNKRVGP